MASEEAKKLDRLELHEEMKSKTGWQITRVPGGWIYSQGNGESSVFVPYENSFFR